MPCIWQAGTTGHIWLRLSPATDFNTILGTIAPYIKLKPLQGKQYSTGYI